MPTEPTRAVIDTNALLDWLVFGAAEASRLGAAVADGRVAWLATPRMLDELHSVLSRPLPERWESARKHAMHAAVAVGLIGALAALGRGVPAALAGDAARPAVLSQLAMGVLLLIYVALGVQSFIAARKARLGR